MYRSISQRTEDTIRLGAVFLPSDTSNPGITSTNPFRVSDFQGFHIPRAGRGDDDIIATLSSGSCATTDGLDDRDGGALERHRLRGTRTQQARRPAGAAKSIKLTFLENF
jgi:hypothetical protein